MAFTAIISTPQVVYQGGAVVKDNTYKANSGGGDWAAGTLLRLNTDGSIEPVDDAASQRVLGIALNAYDASVEGEVFKPVLVLAADTVLQGQLNNATPAAAHIGDQVDIAIGGNFWGVDTTTSNAILEVTDIWVNQNWYQSGKDEAGAYGLCRFKILPAALTAAPNTAT